MKKSIFALAVTALFIFNSCSKSNNDLGSTPAGTYKGVYVGDIPGTSATTGGSIEIDLNDTTGGVAPVISATITPLGGAAITLTSTTLSTWNGTSALSNAAFANSSNAASFALTTNSNGSTATVTSLSVSGISTPVAIIAKGNSVTAYEGSYSGSSTGTWNFLISGTTFSGLADAATLTGTVNGTSITGTWSAPGTSGNTSSSGTFMGAIAGPSVSGTWTGTSSGTTISGNWRSAPVL